MFDQVGVIKAVYVPWRYFVRSWTLQRRIAKNMEWGHRVYASVFLLGDLLTKRRFW